MQGSIKNILKVMIYIKCALLLCTQCCVNQLYAKL